MPHSVFTGRVVEPGEPLFLPDDTAGAVALAEEERDTCPACGMLKAWCRDPAHQFAFDTVEDFCWPTYRLALRQEALDKEGGHEATRRARQTSIRFRDGVEPDVDAGLDLPEQGDQPHDHSEGRGQ